MNHNEVVERLAQIPLFAVLPRAELEHLAATLSLCKLAPGTLLMREGQCDDHFFILLDGEVEVIKALDTIDERSLAIKQGTALFGEMSLFNPQGQHTASVRARTEAWALQMTHQDFDSLLQRFPALVYEMMRQVSRRLEESENATILDLREKNRQLTLAYQELQAAQEQIIIKEKLEKELAIAHQIQQGILPQELPQRAGYDIAALTIPARAVGGDYYDFIPLDGDRLGFVVGDACDKGIPAALLISLTNSLVHVEAPRSPSPEAALRLVNRHLVQMNGSGMFVTLLYGVLDPSGMFDYCRAGHPYPLILDENHLPIETGSGSGMPLGIMEEIQLDARWVSIPPGGMAVMFSDGLNEAADPDGNEFGVQGLVAALPEISHLPAQDVCDGLWERVHRFCGDQPQPDDFTVVVIKREK
jgi:sigma-B regulation protein RsbU (phosphoserine phosphatase)